MSKQALPDVRVIDFSMVWAGPLATSLLADLGAEVIKVESCRRPEVIRSGYLPDGEPGERPYNRGGYFHQLNRNKYGIALDLTYTAGIEIAKTLVKTADVVIENFTPRVMGGFGLDYESLRRIKPDIIMLSMPGFGRDGPYRDFLAYGNITEPMAGLADLTGYPDGPPMRAGLAYGDAVSAFHGAYAILLALHHRRRTGAGQHIDLAQRECLTRLVGKAILEYSFNRRVPRRQGNQHSSIAPHGCYRCKGEDAWITIAIATDDEWKAFRRVIGDPEWARDTRFDDMVGRLKHQEEMNQMIEAWTRGLDHCEAMIILQNAGIAAGAVLSSAEIFADPQVLARDALLTIEHPEADARLHRGVPVRLSKTPGMVKMPAPCLGQHNREILQGLLGLSDEAIEKLTEDGVIGTTPLVSF